MPGEVLDTKVNEKPFEDLKHCTASLTKGVVKFAQVHIYKTLVIKILSGSDPS